MEYIMVGNQINNLTDNRGSQENHWPAASNWQTLSHNVVSSTPCLSGIQTHNSDDRNDCIGRCKYNYDINTAIMAQITKVGIVTSNTVFILLHLRG